MAIPIFYRIAFAVFDLAMPLGGTIANVIAPAAILSGFTPRPVLPPTPETQVLLDGMAGFFAGLAFLHLFLIFVKPNDLPTWRAIQFAVVLQDVFMLGAFTRELIAEGRTNTNVWRGEDWGNLGGYGAILLCRLSFLAGIGMRDDTKLLKGERKEL